MKPANLLLRPGPRPHLLLADFGVAGAAGPREVEGTPAYLPPERLAGAPAHPSQDVYAAGVLIYEMLTGHKPHQADTPLQVAWKHVHEDIPAPSLRTPGIPPYVDALVARATSRDPALRPADAGARQAAGAFREVPKLFSIDDLGGWGKVDAALFADGARYDRAQAARGGR